MWYESVAFLIVRVIVLAQIPSGMVYVYANGGSDVGPRGWSCNISLILVWQYYLERLAWIYDLNPRSQVAGGGAITVSCSGLHSRSHFTNDPRICNC